MSGETRTKTVRLTRAQVREVDRLAIEEYGIPGIVLMENAARGAADVAMTMLPRHDARAAVVCGSGNNGGDGFAVARHLHNRGVFVRIIDASRDLKGDALAMSRIADRMKLDRVDWTAAPSFVRRGRCHLVIDALFGTGLTRAIEGSITDLLNVMNGSDVPILAIDVPSGLDCDTGTRLGQFCIRATRTVTFVAEKIGFARPSSRRWTGKVIVADIGCPRELINRVR